MSFISKTRKGAQLFHDYVIHPTPRNLYSIVFAITYLCNSRCTICNIWEKYRQKPEEAKNELSIDDIRKIFQSSQYLQKVKSLIIGGGEPFLRKDFVEIVLFFYRLNPTINMTIATNGFNSVQIHDKLNEISHILRKKGIHTSSLYIGIALDGMEETHNRIRGRKDAFKKVLETLESIKRIHGIRVGIAFTLTPENYREFLDIRELAKQLRINFGIRFAHASSHYYGNEEKQFVWSNEMILEVRDILIRTGILNYTSNDSLSKRLTNSQHYFWEHYLKYQCQPKRYFDCYSGKHSCFIDPYGHVYPCIMLDKRMGNINDYENCEFDKLWLSRSAEEVREHISGWRCHCFSKCDVPASLERDRRVFLWNIKNMFSSHKQKT